MKYLTIIYLMTLTLHCAAQVVKSKDGISLGKRSEFISNCKKGANKELLNINGMEIIKRYLTVSYEPNITL